jgi:3'(2'), 5'-bisphosphate nucleotidase
MGGAFADRPGRVGRNRHAKGFTMNQPPEASALWEQARRVAVRVARAAWQQAIEPLYFADYHIHEKIDGPCTEADRNADRLIVEMLSREFPEPAYGYLTEESEAQARRLACEHVWIIDPIDGTKEFIKKNGNFAIHIGLVERFADGFHPVAAVVYRPVAGDMYSATRGGGAWRYRVPAGAPLDADLPLGERIHVSGRNTLPTMRSAVSNSHSESRIVRLIKSLELEDFWHIGSLGIKLALIAEGKAELYINLGVGKAKEWDTCAPQLILSEAGGVLTDLEGTVITYNHEDYLMNKGLLASNGLTHAELVERAQAFLAEERAAQK